MPGAVTALHHAVRRQLSHQLGLPPAWRLTAMIGEAWQSATFDGMRHRFCIAFTLSAELAGEAQALSNAVIARLHDRDLPLPGHVLIELGFGRSEIRETGAGGVDCRLWFDALTINDG